MPARNLRSSTGAIVKRGHGYDLRPSALDVVEKLGRRVASLEGRVQDYDAKTGWVGRLRRSNTYRTGVIHSLKFKLMKSTGEVSTLSMKLGGEEKKVDQLNALVEKKSKDLVHAEVDYVNLVERVQALEFELEQKEKLLQARQQLITEYIYK